MTDRETLFIYRLKEAEETLQEARRMLEGNFSSRTIINRAYYSMFYLLLALFLKNDVNIKSSKHKGVLSLFDKEFVKTGKIDKRYSEMLHATFDARLEGDYKELIQFSSDAAAGFVERAEEFLTGVRKLIVE